MGDAEFYNCIEAQLLETARTRLMEEQGNVLRHLTKQGNVLDLKAFLDSLEDRPIYEAVKYAFFKLEIDEDEVTSRKLAASLKHRIYARTVTLPVHADDPEAHVGICANMQWDPDRGGWDCKVSGNQSEADKWHDAWGYGPACRFWQIPNPEALRDQDEELQELYADEDKAGGIPS